MKVKKKIWKKWHNCYNIKNRIYIQAIKIQHQQTQSYDTNTTYTDIFTSQTSTIKAIYIEKKMDEKKTIKNIQN